MTNDIDAIEARAARATKGPWYPYNRMTWPPGDDMGGWEVSFDAENNDGLCEGFRSTMDGHNAAFIAAARTDVPNLCAEVRQLRVMVAAMKETKRGFVAEIDRLTRQIGTPEEGDEAGPRADSWHRERHNWIQQTGGMTLAIESLRTALHQILSTTSEPAIKRFAEDALK